jgi:hypothetical protein
VAHHAARHLDSTPPAKKKMPAVVQQKPQAIAIS